MTDDRRLATNITVVSDHLDAIIIKSLTNSNFNLANPLTNTQITIMANDIRCEILNSKSIYVESTSDKLNSRSMIRSVFANIMYAIEEDKSLNKLEKLSKIKKIICEVRPY